MGCEAVLIGSWLQGQFPSIFLLFQFKNFSNLFTRLDRKWAIVFILVLSKATSKVKLPGTFNCRKKSVNNIHCNILSLLRFDLYIQLSCAFRFLNLICSF